MTLTHHGAQNEHMYTGDANITPIFKKGTKCEARNNRPVSLTSIVCKVMENIMKDDITANFEKIKLII